MNQKVEQILIYGANGYTGQLIIEHAITQGFSPVLAGRNQQQIELLAQKYALSYRVFSLENLETVIENLESFHVLIHCAGPFSATAKPMMLGCIAAKTHYTDITGEIAVFELAQQLNQQAQKAGIVLCPGVGFDVIPTDCLASQLKQQMPDAIELSLAFDSGSQMSPGTAKTSVEGLGGGGKIRKNGQITQVPLAYQCRVIDFGQGPKNTVTIPWGDVSTAYHSTGIPNIQVYIPISPKRAKGMKRLNWFRWFLKTQWVQNKMKAKIAKTTQGPDQQQREKLKTYLWGEVINAKGEKLQGRFETANGYTVTYLGAVAIAKYLLEYQGTGGAFTPSKLVDNQLVQRLEGTTATQFQKIE